ncbi:MAG: PRC-barrel domain-containing protein [Actinomycetota bacterium]|nr:PRC-barrel domain-containing protein [Actinomycetota bacterium]
MTNTDDVATLHTLGDRGQTVAGSANDVRGREVKDKDGDGIGKVADLLVDDRQEKVRFLLVEHGGFLGFGNKTTLIPVDAVTKITDQEVFIDQSHERVATAPGYDPDLVDNRPYHASIYGHYGYEPHWGTSYNYPPRLAFMYPPMSGVSPG